VLSWIIERYNEHLQKIRVYLLKINDKWITLGAEGDLKIKLDRKVVESSVSIRKVTDKKEERTPLPPYTTDTALKDINRLLRISAKEAMKILQQLFENGFITYHRTDSTRVSDKGLDIAKQYLKEDFVGRKWDSGKEGAHECIRPTRPFDWRTLRDLVYQGVLPVYEPLSYNHFRVYDLIFRRFMASQCEKMVAHSCIYELRVEKMDMTKELEILTEIEGRAYELYPYGLRAESPLPEGTYTGIVTYVLKSKAELFTQADVISLMKERSIGRPSTYATLLEKLFIRGYIFEKNSKLVPTRRGVVIEKFLRENYGEFVSEERTRFVEKLMDEVEAGKADYTLTLKELYDEIRNVVR
jgi:reverse gyrase